MGFVRVCWSLRLGDCGDDRGWLCRRRRFLRRRRCYRDPAQGDRSSSAAVWQRACSGSRRPHAPTRDALPQRCRRGHLLMALFLLSRSRYCGPVASVSLGRMFFSESDDGVSESEPSRHSSGHPLGMASYNLVHRDILRESPRVSEGVPAWCALAHRAVPTGNLFWSAVSYI